MDPRVMFKAYFNPGVTDLVVDLTMRGSKSHHDPHDFLVGNQALFADPRALKVQTTTIAALSQVNHLMDHTVVASPKLSLMFTNETDVAVWRRKMTNMRRQGPECMISKIAWRHGHHQPEVWALPEALPSQLRADRIEERRRRRPVGAGAYLAEFTVTVAGALGLHPDQTLTDLLNHINTSLGRTLQHGTTDKALQPDQFFEERDGAGGWNGILVYRLTNGMETRHLHSMIHGGSTSIGGADSPITAFNPKANATCHARPRSGGQPGGRQ